MDAAAQTKPPRRFRRRVHLLGAYWRQDEDGPEWFLDLDLETEANQYGVSVRVAYVERLATDAVYTLGDMASLYTLPSRARAALESVCTRWIEQHQDACVHACIEAMRARGRWWAPQDDEREERGCCGGNSCAQCVGEHRVAP